MNDQLMPVVQSAREFASMVYKRAEFTKDCTTANVNHELSLITEKAYAKIFEFARAMGDEPTDQEIARDKQ